MSHGCAHGDDDGDPRRRQRVQRAFHRLHRRLLGPLPQRRRRQVQRLRHLADAAIPDVDQAHRFGLVRGRKHAFVSFVPSTAPGALSRHLNDRSAISNDTHASEPRAKASGPFSDRSACWRARLGSACFRARFQALWCCGIVIGDLGQRGADDGVSVEDEVPVPMLPLDHGASLRHVGLGGNVQSACVRLSRHGGYACELLSCFTSSAGGLLCET